MVDYFTIRDLTATGDAFTAERENDQALLRPLLELVRVLCEKNAFGQDSPVEVTLTITRVPRVGGAQKTQQR
jgi:chorismate mutase